MCSDRRPGLGAIAVLRQGDALLLVQRGKAPSKGTWAFPGGSVEWAEPMIDAALRELHEETGLVARVQRVLPGIDIIHDDGGAAQHVHLGVVLCDQPQGELRAGDDADAAAWLTLDQMRALPLAPRVLELAEQICAEA